MTPAGSAPEALAERVQRLERENFERSSAVTAAMPSLLAAVAAASARPGYPGSELSRVGQEQAAWAYQQVTEAGVRFLAKAAHLALVHRDDYLRGLLTPGRVRPSVPPPVPPPGGGYGPAQWVGWYQLLVTWVAEQQTRSATLLRTVADEVAAGRLPPDAAQASAQTFVENRIEGYLLELAGLNAELVSEVLDVTQPCLDALAAALGTGPATPVVIDVRGPAASTVTASLLVENGHRAEANVTCLATPADGFTLTVEPTAMRLGAGESRPLTVGVGLPPTATTEPAPAGQITIQGHGASDLLVQVRAQVDPTPPNRPAPRARTR